jgi:hypothetical protein
MRVMFEGNERDFAPDATEFWRLRKIPCTSLRGTVRSCRWLHSDSEANYVKRGNKEFSPESISYEINNFGYRSDEFDETGSVPALMFIGCSYTLGIGIPWESLWSTIVTNHFQTAWGTPVRQYNLAWSGTGGDHVAMIVHQCVDILKPQAIFVLWSYINRLTWFETPRRRHHFFPNSSSIPETEHTAFLRLSTNANAFFNFVKNYNFVVWRLKAVGVPFFCGTYENFDVETLKHYVPTNSFAGRWRRLDLARDNQHSGVQSHARFAEKITGIAKDLQLSSRGVT